MIHYHIRRALSQALRKVQVVALTASFFASDYAEHHGVKAQHAALNKIDTKLRNLDDAIEAAYAFADAVTNEACEKIDDLNDLRQRISSEVL